MAPVEPKSERVPFLEAKSHWTRGLILLLQAMAYSAGVLLFTGLVQGGGRWYSHQPEYRAQVRALLAGQLALSHDPSALRFDHCWSQGGVHQVWGLGVPLWLVPFEGLARAMGFAPFPDLVAFGIALGLAACSLLLSVFHETPVCQPVAPANQAPAPLSQQRPLWFCWTGLAAALALFFPPFLRLLRTRFQVYEQAIAYEYLAGLVLLALLIRLAGRPTPSRWWALCLWAGMGGWIRPTLVLHGIAAVLAGLWLLSKNPEIRCAGTRPQPPRARALLAARYPLVTGVFLFVLGGAGLYATNWLRFGDGFEFGHKLNVQSLYGSLYATRFDHPFATEPLASAARELFGLLFLEKRVTWDWYASHLFPGESSTVRWREIGLPTYDPTYLVLLVPGWTAALLRAARRDRHCNRHSAPHPADPPPAIRQVILGLGVYSGIATFLLGAFYLRNCVIATRYMLDFMPAFTAGMMAGWLVLGLACGRVRSASLRATTLGMAVIGLAAWLAWQCRPMQQIYGEPQLQTRAEAVASLQEHLATQPVTLPLDGRYPDPEAPRATGIPFNGAGWQPEPEGMLMPCAILFVDSPRLLELELEEISDAPIPADPHAIRAKVGLEMLTRESVERTERGWRIRFAAPRRRGYREGIQPVFLATVPPAFLAAQQGLPWRLREVRWR